MRRPRHRHARQEFCNKRWPCPSVSGDPTAKLASVRTRRLRFIDRGRDVLVQVLEARERLGDGQTASSEFQADDVSTMMKRDQVSLPPFPVRFSPQFPQYLLERAFSGAWSACIQCLTSPHARRECHLASFQDLNRLCRFVQTGAQGAPTPRREAPRQARRREDAQGRANGAQQPDQPSRPRAAFSSRDRRAVTRVTFRTGRHLPTRPCSRVWARVRRCV